MVAVGVALLVPGFSEHVTHRILHKHLFMVRFRLDDSAPIPSLFSLLGASAAECACPTCGSLLAQFLQQVKEGTLLARSDSLHGLVSPSGGPAFRF